jgi:glycine oxidase
MSDILIIGAGAVGCLTAMELTRRGARVTLVERGELGREASWAGGGILFPLLPWRYGEAVNRLALAGAASYPMLAEELHSATGIDPEYIVSGMRALPDFGGDAALQWCAGHGVMAEMQAGALWLPQVAQVRNPCLMLALRLWLENNGVQLREHTVVNGLEVTGNRVASVQTGVGALHADHIVVTAGAWSRPLLGEHALALDLKPIRGQMLLYRPPPGVLQQIYFQDDFYLIPRRDGHILAGSTLEDVGFDKSTTVEAAGELHRKAEALLPALRDRQPIRHWSGLRPGSSDNIPVIGRHPALKNLWLNTGHFRYGVTMAPASSRLIASLLAGETPFMDGSPYTFGA